MLQTCWQYGNQSLITNILIEDLWATGFRFSSSLHLHRLLQLPAHHLHLPLPSSSGISLSGHSDGLCKQTFYPLDLICELLVQLNED